LIGRAHDVAARCHQGQKRRSGDAYITHPVAVAAILAGLGTVDDQMLCAAILHDTVEDTPYTLTAMSREFGPGIAAMVAGIMALDGSRRRFRHKLARAIAAAQSADTRVVEMKLADRLHNMQTIRYLPQPKQLRGARQSLDIFVPVAEQLRLPTVTSELETLAAATLTRRQVAGHGLLRQPPILRRPAAHQRTIVALDIERSTSRPDRSRPNSARPCTTCSTRRYAPPESSPATATASPTGVTASWRSFMKWTTRRRCC
jgi:hypothetical protein